MTLMASEINVRPTPSPGPLFFRFSVEAYHQLHDLGIIEEGSPYELLDGQILRKDRSATGDSPMTVGNRHAMAVKRLARLDRLLDGADCHMLTQLPVQLTSDGEPEPDAAIVLGTIEDYSERAPTASDVTSIIEVADSSIRLDRTIKHRMYAAAGIPQYVIVNLVEGCVEVYTVPERERGEYATLVILREGQDVAFHIADGGALAVAVSSLCRDLSP